MQINKWIPFPVMKRMYENTIYNSLIIINLYYCGLNIFRHLKCSSPPLQLLCLHNYMLRFATYNDSHLSIECTCLLLWFQMLCKLYVSCDGFFRSHQLQIQRPLSGDDKELSAIKWCQENWLITRDNMSAFSVLMEIRERNWKKIRVFTFVAQLKVVGNK